MIQVGNIDCYFVFKYVTGKDSTFLPFGLFHSCSCWAHVKNSGIVPFSQKIWNSSSVLACNVRALPQGSTTAGTIDYPTYHLKVIKLPCKSYISAFEEDI